MTDSIVFFGQTTSFLEIVAMLTGIAGVWFTIRQSTWCFPIGIVNVGLYAILFMTPGVRLYADALLQCIYVGLLIYGWIEWKKKIPGVDELKPQTIAPTLWLLLVLITIGSTIFMGIIFREYTNASLPFLDSFLTSVSLVAQWLIARKKIENWLLWIFADVIYIPLYIYKQLPFTAFLYFIFLGMAIKGFIDWKKSSIQPVH